MPLDLFLFTNRRRTREKVLLWDGTGFTPGETFTLDFAIADFGDDGTFDSGVYLASLQGVVPEPSSIALVGLVLAGLAWRGRRELRL